MSGRQRDKPLILLSAGGTGGHLFPAQALAEALVERGYEVDLAADERVDRFRSSFPAREVHVVPSATLSARNPVAYARTGLVLGSGFLRALGILRRTGPKAVVGFGGYPTVPPLLAARTLRIKTAIHEQNAVLGRANRMLASKVDLVATSFPKVHMLGENAAKAVFTGAPVRAAVKAAARPYEAPAVDGEFRLLVFGGSQGAKILSDVVPGAVARLPEADRRRLKIVQQCRQEDIARVRAGYGALGVEAELQPFFMDMPQRIADAHLVVSRSGASTVAELAVIGRPGILIPLPHALDNDQLLNATAMAKAGGGWLLPQASLDAHRLADEIKNRMDDPQGLAAGASAAGQVGNADAAATLADVVIALAEGRAIPNTKSGHHE
ncbi:undecaprenyldiphospho-muramoylpentapeptide beta-N-acetylglucosaminyltransferase [Lutibaculum baratangense]|uniref:UDP-N-acetylglucosamine--N-acetylmuramyl-(pentapeptide) pyrophosphoryl-undecaprenol N-acetylglucosamine transferase n=1 Tax=Lutibaculum baratangense AMV1 TaxID=631454 RepID=V4RMS8_9HYPH|nr:undecaprenyldiphospho-muramoylpentapeptide beta-N-acetylglucosaminyltransferase [Lutibaculum baratangense]ESR27331.1 UDP-N-acetylglucosamine--N-acetylmuramyl- (pentapeptide) pyrophosphoryl-undecaprenol N-acetylglucosamine transferase [Lutibaculum baratangense AMV1]